MKKCDCHHRVWQATPAWTKASQKRQLGLVFIITASGPGPPGVWTQEARVSNHLLKKIYFTERKKFAKEKVLQFTILQFTS